MKRRVRLSLPEARRIALAAQGFSRPRPHGEPDTRHFRRVLQTLGLLQLDFVNVLMPAHLLVVWSRLGAYDRARLHRYLYDSTEATEQWAHEASIVPSSSWPLLEYRRASYTPYKHSPIMKLRGRNAYLDRVIAQVREEGALCSAELPPMPGPKRKPGDWHRSVPRWALEVHFGRGALAVKSRKTNFQRIFDLPERVLTADCLCESPGTDESHRRLLLQAARSMGVATAADLADYYRMSPREAMPRILELEKTGALKEVTVESWDKPAYLYPDARLPKEILGKSILSPFDPVVWFRPRAERLFDFRYRIEIYVPEAKREWGYYVLPFRVGDRLAARVDLKADRNSGKLLVKSAYVEHGEAPNEIADALADELGDIRRWLALDETVVTRMNDFSRLLARAV